MLRIRAWAKWQGDALYDRMRKRTPSGRTKPISLAFIALSTNLDDASGNFSRFADLVGGGILARGYLVMILGYLGRMDATTGVIRCRPDQLGPVMLTDRTVQTSPKVGARVYAALLESGIAEEVAPEDVREIAPPASRSSSPEASPPSSPEASPGSGGRRGEERRGEREESPPLPPERGGANPAAPEERPARRVEMRPRDRQRFGAVLDYVIRCGTSGDQLDAIQIRRRFKSGDVADPEIAELLAGRFGWVTTDRLSRFRNEGKNGTARSA